MKKLLMTAAAVSMLSTGVSFAAESDSFTGTITLTAPNTCAINPDAAVSASSGTPSAATMADLGSVTVPDAVLDSDGDGIIDTDVTVSLQFTGGSVFCNYAHNFTIQASFGGFAAEDESGVGAGSDAFMDGIPYDLGVSFWDNTVNSATYIAANSVVADYLATADPATAGADSSTTAAVPAFHNDGDIATEAGTTDNGLKLDFVTNFATATNAALPLLAGDFTEKFHLKIGAAL